jgi:anti-sigma regulatory factor (Ser/Thr protein kinase)/ActR/RegA family two-component response regulator
MAETKSFPQSSSAIYSGGGRVLVIAADAVASQPLEASLLERNCLVDRAAGSADALRRLRRTAYDVIFTDPATSIEEDLALLLEMRAIRPGARVIVLSPDTTPEEVIAALRARVFLLRTAPFDTGELAEFAVQAATTIESSWGIETLSAHRDWVSVRVNCQLLTAERLVSFLKELQSELPESPREDLMMAFREILMNAMEHGGHFQPDKVVDVTAIHTARAIVLYVHDPGAGFRWEAIPHSALSNPPNDPAHHVEVRQQQGMRPGGFGLLVAKGIVNEMLYSEVGNEVLLIKYLA